MSASQPSALVAITAALAAPKQPPVVNPVTLPVNAQPFAFVPQSAVVPTIQVGPGVAPANAPAPAFNPFQPSPVQAQAAFVAAVPRAAEQHVHPTTGVPFAPINPPGEASSAPTVGLDSLPAPHPIVNVQIVQPVQTSATELPKAPRTRKRREAPATTAELCAIALNEATASHAGDGAAEPVAESAAPLTQADGDVAAANGRVSACSFNTEDLCAALEDRGWAVTLKAKAYA